MATRSGSYLIPYQRWWFVPERGAGAPRATMLETIREYALEQLHVTEPSVSPDTELRELRLRLAAALGNFWYRTGRATEDVGWLTGALADSDLPPVLRAPRDQRTSSRSVT